MKKIFSHENSFGFAAILLLLLFVGYTIYFVHGVSKTVATANQSPAVTSANPVAIDTVKLQAFLDSFPTDATTTQ